MRHGNRSTAKLAGFCLLALVLAAGGTTAATLTGMTVTSEGEVTRIHLKLDQPVEWSHFVLTDPPRLYVDCRGVASVLPKTLPQGTGRAGDIEASVWKGEGKHALTRISIDLTRPSRAQVSKVEDGLLIALGPMEGREWTSGDESSSPESTEAATPTPESATVSETPSVPESTRTPAETMNPPATTTQTNTSRTMNPPAMPPAPAPTESTNVKPSPLPVPPEGTRGEAQARTESTGSTTEAKSTAPATESTKTESKTTTTGTSTTGTKTTTGTSDSGTKTTTSETPSTVAKTTTTTQATTTAPTAKTVGPEPASTTTTTAKPMGPERAPAATSATPPTTSSTPAETMVPPSGTHNQPVGPAPELTPAEESAPSPAPAPDQEAYRASEPAASYTGTRTKAVKTIKQSDEAGLAARGGARVSLDIQGADIYTVLRSISEYSGVNIVMGYDVSKSVNDPVSFHLENVPWGEALEMVLRSAHLWYREEGNIIRVDTEENLRNEELARSNAARQLEEVMPLTTRIVEVIYANAAEVKPTVEKSLSKRGVLEVDERTNSLVVTDIRSRVEAAVEMIQHLDSQTPQVEINAKLVDVDARFERDLGVLWNVSDVHVDGASLDGHLGANDVIDPTAQVRFGLVRSWGTVSAVLSAMERDNKADIISNPSITTVNNREARILVGKKIPLIVLDEAGNPVTELTTIGITLRVTPHINDQNRITLDMHPEVSDLSSQATVQGGVIINTSEADTRVMVGNGETAVIGGLIRSNDTKLKRGVPILKDVPILGAFFSSTQDVREKRELLIFVTPRIVTSFNKDGE